MTNDTNFVLVHSWLCQCSIDSPGKVKWLHPSICLLSLALAHSPKVEAQCHRACFCRQALSQGHSEWVMHIATDRLGVAEDSNWRMFHLERFM